jgi:cytochrome b
MPMTDDSPAIVTVAVWDWPVRVVHWAMVALVAALLTTGLIGGDMLLVWHMRAGETLLALVLFRLLWGFAGSRNARFTTFVRGPAAVVAYAKSIRRPDRHAYASHNPLGGWMTVAILLALLVQAGTGLFTNDDVLTEGPLARLITKDLSDAISTLHRCGWWLIAGLALVHVVAVLSYLAVLKDNLVVAMASGRKRLPSGVARADDATASGARAIVLLALCAALIWWTVNRL